MKKSNIILLIILGLFIAVIILLQLRIKSYVNKIQEIQVDQSAFDQIEVKSGWHVELHNDTLTKIIIHADSLKTLISVKDNKLILHETHTKMNQSIKILNPAVREISTYGSSSVQYYNEAIDSLHLSLYDDSSLRIQARTRSDEKADSIDIRGNIKYVNFKAHNSSWLKIYHHVHSMEGILNDTSGCQILGKVHITNLEKSEHAKINSW